MYTDVVTLSQEKRRQYDMATAKELANDAMMVGLLLLLLLICNYYIII